MTMIRSLPARERITRARSALVTSQPFFGCLALHLDVVERPSVGTMAVDGRALYYAPEFVAELSEAELIGVLAHEVMHLALLHHVRRGGRDPKLWNDAADYCINGALLAQAFTLPASRLDSREFDGMGAEQVYSILAGRQQGQQGQQGAGQGQGAPVPSPGAGGPEDGSGQPDASGQAAPDSARCGGVLDAAPDGASLAEAAAEMESRVRQAISVAAAGAGMMPGDAARILAELNAPRVSWRDVVARFVDDAATRRTEWTRPDKRFIGSGFFMPGRSADSVSCLAAAIDNSGSVSDDELSAFASELQGILDTGKVERLHVVLCDSDVNGSADFVPGDIVRLEGKGGGGTRFGPAFRHLAEHAPDAAAVLYATDLDVAAGDWGTDPGCPVLWLATGGRRSAPFGEVIPLDAYA